MHINDQNYSEINYSSKTLEDIYSLIVDLFNTNIKYENKELDIDLYCDGINDILLEIYKSKQLNVHYIRQEILRFLVIKYKYPFTCFNFSEEGEKELKQFKYLCDLPQTVQRSAQWHEERSNMLTASELSTVFKKNPYKTPNNYIIDKVIPKPRMSNRFCDHGIKYEDVVTLLYSKINKCKIHEFGCLKHPVHNFLGASPDGITDIGRMIEIKCTVAREITGIPPIYYWHQMQLQMEVANLNSCDFIECKFEEYDNLEAFLEDSYPYNFLLTKNKEMKGSIIEYFDVDENKNAFLYNIENFDIENWENNSIDYIIKNNKDNTFIKKTYWKLPIYSCVRVFRDIEWFYANFSVIREFWNRVIHHKLNGVDDLISKKRVYKKKEQICLIMDSDDCDDINKNDINKNDINKNDINKNDINKVKINTDCCLINSSEDD
jgi:putative phage-type endonuclease